MTSLRYALLIAAAVPAVATAADRRPYDVQHYRIDMRLEKDGAFENTVHVTLIPGSEIDTVELDSYGLDIQRVALGEQKIPFTLEANEAKQTGLLTLRPKAPLPALKAVTFDIQYKGKAGNAHQGFFKSGAYFTHFEPDHARSFVPSNDRPDDKATTELLAVVDAGFTVLSTGQKALDETFSESGEILRRVQWKQTTPIPLYTFAIAIGRFEGVALGSPITPSTIWVRPGAKDRAFVAQDATLKALSFQQTYLGVKYPWARFDQVTVPRFVWGATENTTLVMMRESRLLLEDKSDLHSRHGIRRSIAHELAHQWFGNYVTCSSFADLWLNEGFATFLGHKTVDDYNGNDLVEVERAVDTFVRYFRLEDGARSRPLVSRKGLAAGGEFDEIAYSKGAHVLRMLEHWVGPAQFRKGMKAYLESYAYKNASSEDFFAAFTRATDTEKELRAFKEDWLYQRGYPVVVPKAQWNGKELELTLTQRSNHPDDKSSFTFKLPVVFHGEGESSWAKEEVILVDKPVVKVKFALPARPKWINWNKEGVALVRIDSAGVAEDMWTWGARFDPDPVWRTLSAFVLMDPLVDPNATQMKVPSEAAMSAMTHVLTKDPSPYVREAVLNRLTNSSFKRLPEPFGHTFFELAQRPAHLPDDAVGVIRVRRAALAALGKVQHKEGRTYLLQLLMLRDVDLNYLPALAEGTARLGDVESMATLKAAVTQSKARGFPYYRGAAAALGLVPYPEVLTTIGEVLEENEGSDELINSMLKKLRNNAILLKAPEFPGFVREFVLRTQSGSGELKEQMLNLLDEVKSKSARDALLAISQKAASERLQSRAKQLLVKNFPPRRPGDVGVETSLSSGP